MLNVRVTYLNDILALQEDFLSNLTTESTDPILVWNDDVSVLVILQRLVIIIKDDSSHGVLLHVAIVALLHILIINVISHAPGRRNRGNYQVIQYIHTSAYRVHM